MTNKRVFITGGCGFLGSAVVRKLLSMGYLITVYDNLSTGQLEYLPTHSKIRFIQGDVTNWEMISSIIKGHDYVIHLAAQAFIPMSYNFPDIIAQTNTIGSLYLFKACIKKGIKRIVHVSSSEVYGSAKYIPIDEKHPLNPISTYAVSKLASDQWAKTFAYEHNLPIIILRPFNTFGPRDTCPRFIPEAIRQCLKKPTIKVGNISSSRDFTYVDDTALAIILALEKEITESEIINIGTGKSWKISKILKMIKEKTGNKNKRVIHDIKRMRPEDVKLLMSSTIKAFKILGWKAKVELHEGLQKTIEWYIEKGKKWGYEKQIHKWKNYI